MNKYGLFFSTVFFLSQVIFAASPIIFQQATSDDVPQLLHLYSGFTQDDADRLVVFPIEVREVFLNKAIALGRVFVAKDTAKPGSPIVSFCKLFMVGSDAELIEIVRNELVAVADDSSVNKPFRAAQLFLPNNFATDFTTAPNEVAGDVEPYVFNPKDTYVYYGGSYTHPDYRKHGYCTQLERYALESIRPAVTARLREHAGHLFYIYGVVLANYGGLARHRSFVQFIHKIGVDLGFSEAAAEEMDIMFYAFHACKPTFCMDRADLKIIFEEKGRGFGCFLGCNMTAAG